MTNESENLFKRSENWLRSSALFTGTILFTSSEFDRSADRFLFRTEKNDWNYSSEKRKSESTYKLTFSDLWRLLLLCRSKTSFIETKKKTRKTRKFCETSSLWQKKKNEKTKPSEDENSSCLSSTSSVRRFLIRLFCSMCSLCSSVFFLFFSLTFKQGWSKIYENE